MGLTAAELLKHSEFLVLNEELELLGQGPFLAKLAYLKLYGVTLNQIGLDSEVVTIHWSERALLTFFACG